MDTRAGDAPGGRTYFAPFARVWDSLLRDVERQKGWTLVHADEELGILTISCRSPLLRLEDDLTVWVGLDDNGLTRVDARSVSHGGPGRGVNRRRLGGLLERLDGSLGADARADGLREAPAASRRGSGPLSRPGRRPARAPGAAPPLPTGRPGSTR